MLLPEVPTFLAGCMLGAAVTAALMGASRRRLLRDFQTLQYRLGMVFWVRDLSTGKITNHADPRGVLGRDVQNFEDLARAIHPGDREVLRQNFAHPKPGPIPMVEFRVFANTGNVRWLAVSAECVADRKGKPRRLIGGTICTDAEHLAREAAEQAQSDHRHIFDAAPMLIWYKDRHNRILRINRAAAAAIARGVPDVEGRPTKEFYPDHHEKFYADDQEVVTSGQAKLGIVEVVNTREGSRWVRTDKIPYRNAAGEIIGVIVFALDITEQKRAELHLAAALQAKGELLAALSHELRTPLAVMLGFSELLAREGAEPAVRLDYARRILDHGRHLAALIDEILDLSKAERMALPVTIGDVEPRALLGEAVAMLLPQARSKGLALELSVAADVPERLRSDPMRLRQILINIIGNAIKFTPRGSVLVEATLTAGDEPLLLVDVVDTGIGVEPSALGRLFEPFFQVQPRGSGPRGTGLGLALSKKLAVALGGDLVLANTEVGRGSRFRLTVALRGPASDLA